MSQFSFVQLLSHQLGEYAVERGGLRKKVAGRQLFTFSLLRVVRGDKRRNRTSAKFKIYRGYPRPCKV